jgi:hypothetical protein
VEYELANLRHKQVVGEKVGNNKYNNITRNPHRHLKVNHDEQQLKQQPQRGHPLNHAK